MGKWSIPFLDDEKGLLSLIFKKPDKGSGIAKANANSSRNMLIESARRQSPSKGSVGQGLLTLQEMKTNTEELKAETPSPTPSKMSLLGPMPKLSESKTQPKIDKKPDKFLGKEVSKGQKIAGNLSTIAAAIDKLKPKQEVTASISVHPSQDDEDYNPFKTLVG